MSTTQQMTPGQQNSMARQAIIGMARKITQPIASGNFVPGQNNSISIQPRYTGLILGFFVELIVSINNTSANPLALTNLNAANILSNVTFLDLNNNQRINTTGWHLALIDTVKTRRVFGASVATDSPIKFGSNYPVISAAPIAANAVGTVRMLYWVPLANNAHDLRGALYANVTSATATLNLTVNPAFSVATGADATLAVYSGQAVGASLSITNVAYTVSQVFYSQLPTDQTGMPILPLQDMATIYELKQTSITGLSAGQDFPYPYANYRQFESTFAIFDNGGTLNAGSDVNYFALQAASYTNFWKVDPTIIAAWTRQMIGTDMPAGVYYFDHRDNPLNIQQYGNLNLLLNPSVVNAGAQVFIGTEAFALTNQVLQAGSLAAG